MEVRLAVLEIWLRIGSRKIDGAPLKIPAHAIKELNDAKGKNLLRILDPGVGC